MWRYEGANHVDDWWRIPGRRPSNAGVQIARRLVWLEWSEQESKSWWGEGEPLNLHRAMYLQGLWVFWVTWEATVSFWTRGWHDPTSIWVIFLWLLFLENAVGQGKKQENCLRGCFKTGENHATRGKLEMMVRSWIALKVEVIGLLMKKVKEEGEVENVIN